MERGVLFALGLIVGAATINGVYAVLLKYMPNWKWENAWILWTVLSLWVLPLGIGLTTLPNLMDVYGGTSSRTLVLMCSLGTLWGVGMLLIGLCFPLVGVAVGFAVSLGSAAALGTLLPLFKQQSESLFEPKGMLILAAVSLLLLGVAFCGLAGRQRERQQGINPLQQGRSLQGFLLAWVGGSLTASLNVALAYGNPILETVQRNVPNRAFAANAVWIPVLFAAGVPGVIYCAWLLHRRASLEAYRRSGTAHYWLLGLLMSASWFGSVLLYGDGVMKIGKLGPVIGWPVFMSGAALASFGWGALTGEWRNSGRQAKVTMAAGTLILILAMGLCGAAGS